MYKYVKRILDIIVSIVILIVFGIPMCIIAFLIWNEDKGSPLFIQDRMGKDHKPFRMYKFRSMKQERNGGNMTHEEMCTNIGKFLRKTSLDELPQIFNVLKGEMSFIGPRPWVLEYYDWMTPEQQRRISVRPGVTGLAQVKGRNGISVLQKIAYDLEYVDNFGLKYDLKILFLSVKVVLKEENAEITEMGISEELKVLESNSKSKKKIKNTD